MIFLHANTRTNHFGSLLDNANIQQFLPVEITVENLIQIWPQQGRYRERKNLAVVHGLPRLAALFITE